MAKVLVPFRDRVTWRLYSVGDDFDGDDGRLSELSAKGIVDGGELSEAPQLPNVSGMTVAQLREACTARGIVVPKKTTKAQLAQALAG